MPVKDYYKILEVPPDAAPEQIKKAWRRLAQLYHPDKDAGGQFSSGYFLELQEAYDVLSNSKKRARYDEERWLDGYSRKKQSQAVTPQWLLDESRRLRAHMAKVDTYRMNHAALHDYVCLLLGDTHMAVLEQAGATAINHAIVQEILRSVRSLDYLYMKDLAPRLAILAVDNESLLRQIHHTEMQSRQQAQWRRYKPYVMMAIAVVLCLCMYLYVRISIR